MRRLLFVLAAFAFISIGASTASATVISYGYGPFNVDFLAGTPVTGAVQGFNTALGTLTGISFNYDASAILFEGNSISAHIAIKDSSGTVLTTIDFPNMTGRDEKVTSGTFSVPLADFADFENTGDVDLTLTPSAACRGSDPNTPSGCQNFTGRVGGTGDFVTYSYTAPTTAVPEPASLALFGTGVVAFGLLRRRNRNRLPD